MERRIFINAFLSILCLLFFCLASIAQEQSIKPSDAQRYIGEEKTVCGIVASATYARRSKGQPTFLNLDQPYPNQIFTVLIWGSDRQNFQNPPETIYRGKNICVSGIIKIFREKPEIIVHNPSQIIIKPNN